MSGASNRGTRGTILLEDARVLRQDAFAGEQHVLRIAAPGMAAAAAPGQFAHLRCDPELQMRRPLSIMRADADAGWVEFLYKRVGHGTDRLAAQPEGARLSVLGPVGQPFGLRPERPRPLLVGGGVGIPPMVFLADRLRDREGFQALTLMGSEVPFPFTPRPSTILVPGMPPGTIACMPLLEDWGVASRLASLQDFAGCHRGYVTDLAAHWLEALPAQARAQVEILACGPEPMLRAAVAVARRFALPCQVCLEEYMACAVGGCAGCVVRVLEEDGPAMRRVCVDGPVFDGHRIAWA